MTPIHTEGVILQAITFRDVDQILTVLTPEGIIKLFFKGSLSQKYGRGSLTTPLQLAELVYTTRRSEIAACSEISILNRFPAMRSKLEFLESAGEMGAAILATQQMHEPLPLLYQLFLRYLENIPHASDPFLLAASFKLKILRHEGVLLPDGACAACGEALSDIYIDGGESFCCEHAPAGAAAFAGDDALLLLESTYGRSMGRLAALATTPAFLRQVRALFDRAL